MSLYPESVARCRHIKVNGTQCGSPALREEKYCYFHMRWHTTRMLSAPEGARALDRWATYA